MSDPIDPAGTRTKLVEQINAKLANIEIAEKRVNKAKAELGTAERELAVMRNEYSSLLGRLQKNLPTMEQA